MYTIKKRKLEWRRAHYRKLIMGIKRDWLYSNIALLFIKTQTCTHAHTHAHKSILSKIIFFKCLFEQDFRWFIANRKGEIVPIVFSNDGSAKRLASFLSLTYSNKRH